jgi:hypothetical protein
MWPNLAAAGNGAITPLFHAGCSCSAVPEPYRWAKRPSVVWRI